MKQTVEYIDKSGQKLVITTVGDELLLTTPTGKPAGF